MKREDIASHRGLIAGHLCLGALFFVDVRYPFGELAAIAYVVVVVSSFFFSASDAIILASVATAANILGYLLAPPSETTAWVVATIRGATVFTTWLMIVAGIHFHKQSQAVIATIRETNERRRLALEGAELAFWDLDVPREMFDFDVRWILSLGYSALDAHMSIERLESLVHPDDLPSNRLKWKAHVDGLTPRFEVEQRLRTADGHWRRVVTKGRIIARDEVGSPLRVAGTHLDVTEAFELKQKAEQAQEDRLRELQLLTDAIPMLIGYVDATQTIQFANAAYGDTYDVPLDQINGRPFRELVGDEAFHRLEPHINAVLRGKRVQFEEQIFHGESIRFYLFQFLPRVDDVASVIGFYALVTDITGLKRSQEEVDLQREALALFNRRGAANEMAAALAHEMNQPLGSIAVYAGRLIELHKEGKLQPDDVIHAMEFMREEALRAGQVVKRARLMVDDKMIQPSTIDASDLLDSVKKICGTKAAAQRCAIEVQVTDGAVLVFADRIQLQQVLVNLISNSIDATAGLEVGRKIITATANSNGEGAHFSVIDRGTGLLSDNREVVYQPHYTTKSDGLGIGLTIARKIISMHGGRLWSTPNVDYGVTFHVTLPPEPVDIPRENSAETLPLLPNIG